jgi:uncharacterized membrane protein
MAEEAKLTFTPEEIEEGKGIAWIAYIPPLFFIPLVVKKDNPFCKAHAKLGLALLLGWVVSWILSFVIIGFLTDLALFILSIIALIKAFQGRYWEMPLFHSIAKLFKF